MTRTDMINSCPETRRVNHRRNEQRKWRRGAKWRAFVAEHTKGKVCERCLKAHGDIRYDKNGNTRFNKLGQIVRVVLTVNHTSRRKYLTEEEYCTWDDDCEVCCTVCNWMYEKAKIPCPKCHNRYIRWDESECLSCYLKEHPEAQAKIDAAKEQKRIDQNARARKKRDAKRVFLHPCKKRGREQRCRRRPGEVCRYPARTARKCPYFKEKEIIKAVTA